MSDDEDDVRALQGVSWFKRKAVTLATIELHTKQYRTDDAVEHVDIRETISGGFEGTLVNQTADWTTRSFESTLFGPCNTRCRRCKLDEVDVPWLEEGWLPEIAEQGVLQVVLESDTEKSGTTWRKSSTWGFEDIDGERRFTHHIDFFGPKEEHLQKRIVFDFVEETE